MPNEKPNFSPEVSYEESSKKFREIMQQIFKIFPLLREKGIIEKSKYGDLEDFNKYIIYPLFEKYDRMELLQFGAYHNLIHSTPPKGLAFDSSDRKIEKFVKEKLAEFQQVLSN